MVRYGIIVAALLLGAGQASATWADSMFDNLSRDFGSVPRGPVIAHPFRLVNNTAQTVRIAQVRVSCGCVTAYPLTYTLAPGQETAVLANMDTRRFYGSRTVTIYVTFDQPQFAEVRLWVQANSRDDVSVTPDVMNFGRIKRGSSPEAKVAVSLLGNGEWRITQVVSETNYIQPRVDIVRQGAYEVTYQLTCKVRADAPPGRWYTDVWLTTNNAAMPKVRVPITVEIESALSVNPGTVVMGSIKAGSEAQRKIIVRGVEPFKITGVKGADGEVRVLEGGDDAKTVHVLTVSVRPARPGEINRQIQVLTDLRGEATIDFTARAFAVP